MQIKINDKDVELNFGVKFVRELDKIAGIDVNGASFGMGLTKSIPGMQALDPAVLSDVIYSATAHIKMNRPSRDDIDDYIDHCSNIEKLFDQVSKEMKEANAIKAALKNAKA